MSTVIKKIDLNCVHNSKAKREKNVSSSKYFFFFRYRSCDGKSDAIRTMSNKQVILRWQNVKIFAIANACPNTSNEARATVLPMFNQRVCNDIHNETLMQTHTERDIHIQTERVTLLRTKSTKQTGC